MVAMYLGKADVNTYDKGVEREFLVSSGTGSYGSSTVVGANTRREHGMLVVRPQNSEQHTVLISKLEETLYAENKKYQLSTNRYKDLVYPDGYRYVQEYQGVPHPSVLFVIHSIFLKKSVFMPRAGTSTVVKYELLAAPEPVSIDIRPLFAHRAAGEIPDCKAAFESSYSADGIVSVRGRNLTSHVSFARVGAEGQAPNAKWSAKQLWFENLIYERDGEPEQPIPDHLWSPGYGSITLSQGDVLYVVLSEEPIAYTAGDIQVLENETVEMLSRFVKEAPLDTQLGIVQDMLQSSCHLVADNKGSEPAIFSGFPSVKQRARDTFISLPGLTLVTDRRETAKGILAAWLERAKMCDWIVPASVNNAGELVTGDIDAGLWLLYAVSKYTNVCGLDFARENYDALRAILEKYTEGCELLGAVMDPTSKLIKYFNRDHTCHWMSGDVSGEPLVDRRGCLVEMSALWYNALKFTQTVAEAAGDAESAAKFGGTADEVKRSFESTFWNEDGKYLYDWVDPTDGVRDDAIRPNALLAVSLPYPVLDGEKGKAVFTTSWNELYTTYGLRTLDPHHDKFKGRSEGRPDQKKKARLRGMAWPWLMGQFVTAYMRFNPAATDMGWMFIRPFSSHLRRGCLGGVAEYFDGVMPYRPHGDVLSAMSLGELLRAMKEDLGQK